MSWKVLSKAWAVSLSLTLFAVHCTVTSDDDVDTECEPNETRSCTCADGSKGTQSCTPGGTRFNACVCPNDGGAGGGESSGGSGGEGQGGQNRGGAGAGGAGGGAESAGAGGDSAGSSGAGAGGAGGAFGQAGSAGFSGSGVGGAGALCDATPPKDSCEACLLSQCCEEYVACAEDDACFDEWDPFEACVLDLRQSDEATPANVKICADAINADSMGNPLPPSPATAALIACMAGSSTWANSSTWSSMACSNGCFEPAAQ